jgi:LCP family protein required for cell wall assembly
MADDDQYRWLSSDDPDATRAIPRPDATAGSPAADETQVMPQPPRPDQTRQQPRTPAQPPPPPAPVLPPPGRSGTRDSRISRGSTSLAERPPRRRGRTVRRVLLALLVVWVIFLVAVPLWAWSKIEKVDAEPAERPADQPGTTYLLVGSDSREDLSEEERQELATGNVAGQRTDTILLLHTGDGPTLLMSIPRDSQVEIPGQGEQKINAAYGLGGPELLVQTIEENTGIRVDGYVEIGLGGFVDVVDSVGGVEVCPDEAVQDIKAGLDIQAGCQELDGPDALGYARTRAFATGDLQRVQNQREVVGAIADKALSPWTLLNPWRYFQLASSGADSVSIGEDVGPVDLARFAYALGRATGGGGLTCTVPIADLEVNWDADRAPQMFRLIAEDRTDEISDDLCRSTGLTR